MKARLRSFSYAFNGIQDLFSSEQNMFVHLLATVVVIMLGFVFHISPIEWTVLILATGFVWVAEILNTAIEKIMDFISGEKKPQIKFIKDISAAAVLVSAVTALAAGCLIFIPKL
ncbi:MAG TPA: diacylglycerol kinase family protein [Chitinophagaceae bacterium]|nr:diacylglycerol kinase family protein [Chitinophagaceae bacterium]